MIGSIPSFFRIRRINAAAVAVFAVLTFTILKPSTGLVAAEPGRWEKAIQAFEKQDQEMPPLANGLLFVGSSSIRMWDLSKFFPDLPALNRGFGGSQTSDVIEFADRIVIPYKPAVIVLYEGDNDIAAGKTADQVAADFQQLIDKIHDALPQTRVLFVSIKPSLKRWDMYPTMKAANDKIEMLTKQDPRLGFVDVSTVMLDENGMPQAEIFLDDGLHMNKEGYRRWSTLLRPKLNEMRQR